MKPFLKIFFLISAFCFFSCEYERKEGSNTRISALLDKAQNVSADVSLRQKYLDSATTELGKNKNDSVTRYYYRKTTAAYYNLELYNKAITSANKIYNLSIEAKDTLSMARALYYSADSYYGKAYNDSAFYYYTQAEKLYSHLQDSGTLGEIILYKAYIYYDIGEYAMCESEAFKALRFLQNGNKTIHIYNCYNLIATAVDGQDNNNEALKYYQYALRQLDQFKREGYSDNDINIYLATCYNNMGGVYVKMELHREAISLYNKALQFDNLKSEMPGLYAKLLNNLAYAKFKSGDYKGLPALFYKSLNIRDSLNNKSGIVASHIYLGEYYAFKKDTAKAIGYFKSAYEGAVEIKSHFETLNALKLLSSTDIKNSSFYSAKYIAVNDEMQETSKKNRDKFARIEYETDKLETEKQALLKKNSFIIGASAVALLFIAAIFIIYYLNSRNKKLLLIQQQQKANEEIYQLMFEQQSKVDEARTEEKNRIAMELHDGILNNIYAVRLNLEFINRKSDDEAVLKRKEFIKELQNVESEIRGLSHDLSRNALFKGDKSFGTLLEYMIKSQKNKFETVFMTDIDPSIDWDNMSNISNVNVYRIVQEALQNINKYAEATLATISIRKNEGSIIVRITDNGIGFETDRTKDGIGLKNLKKRAAILNAELIISSEPGKGSSIEFIFPIQETSIM